MNRACFALLPLVLSFAGGADWLAFRGADSNNVAVDKNQLLQTLPDAWNPQAGEGVAWRVDLPGRGPSSPIVVKGRVVLTASSGADQDRLHVLCFDAAQGQPLWHRQFWATGRTITHPTSANAAPTPASDGEQIYAFFSSNDLICLDLDGNVCWLRGLAYDFPRAGNDVGMAASPLVMGKTVIVQIENQGDSFAAGIDTLSGETRWRLERSPQANWASPIAFRGKTPAEDRVLLQSPDRITAHDPATGGEIWSYKAECSGIPSAVACEGIVYVPAEGVVALEPPSSGGEPTVKWKAAGVQPGAASPLVSDGRLFAVNRAGVLNCVDIKSGEATWKVRLTGSFWSSPMLVGNRLYCFNQEGLAQVVELSADGKKGQIIGKADFGEGIQSSPAVADGALYVRSDRHLWKIQKDAVSK